jgi:hypothetical protein
LSGNKKPGAELLQHGIRTDRLSAILVDRVADGVLDAADRVLQLAGSPIALAFGFHLGIPDGFADAFLDLAFDILGSALDPIFVHDKLLVQVLSGT